MPRTVRTLLPTLVLALFIAPFASALGPEIPIGTRYVGPAPSTRWFPYVAAGSGATGNEFFAIWSDSRVDQNRIVGTRLNAAGQPLDPMGIPISSGTQFNPAIEPRVIWTGSTWLALWTSYLFNTPSGSIIAARIDRDGKLVGSPYAIATGTTGLGQWVASDGNITVVAYRDYQSSSPHAKVLDRDGNLIRDVAIPSAWRVTNDFAVTASNSQFAIAWTVLDAPTYEVEAIRLDKNGELIDSAPKNLGLAREPFLASDGTNFLMLARRLDHDRLIFASQKLSATLEPGEATFVPDAHMLQSPSLMWRGDSYALVAQRNSDIEPRLDIAAITIDSDGKPSPSAQSIGDLNLYRIDPQLTAASLNGKLVVMWVENDSFFSIGTFARTYTTIDRNNAGPTTLLSQSADPHYAPATAYGNGVILAAWRGLGGINVTRVTPDGRSLDSSNIRVAFGSSNPAVAFDGTNFVVATNLGGWAFIYFFSPTDGYLPEKDLRVDIGDTDGGPLALVSTADALYLGWVDDYSRVMISRVPHATHIAEMPVAVSPVSDEYEYAATTPQLAWNGTNFLVTWTEWGWQIGSPPYPAPMRIAAARVSASLTLLDPMPLIISPSDRGADYDPSVATNGTDFVVTWQSAYGADARRVYADGTMGAITNIAAGASYPRVTFNGSRYVVAWKENDFRASLRIGYLPSTGELLRSGVAQLAFTDTNENGVALAPTPNGTAALYTRVSTGDEYGGVPRSFLRLVGASTKRRAVH